MDHLNLTDTLPQPDGELAQAQGEVRERMTLKIDSLVQDQDLRQALFLVNESFYKAQVEDPEADLTAEERERNSAVYLQNVALVLGYNDIYGLRQATGAIFNRRSGGSERQDVGVIDYGDVANNHVRGLAQKYHLAGNSLPEHDEYAAAIVMGGAANAFLHRAEYLAVDVPALLAMQGREFHTGMDILLASYRPVPADEVARAKPYAAGSRYEFDLGESAAQEVYAADFTDGTFEATDPSLINYLRRLPNKKETESETETRNRYARLQAELGGLAAGARRAAEIEHELKKITLPQPPNKWRVAAATAADGHQVFVLTAGMQTDVFGSNGRRRDRPNSADTIELLSKVMSDLEPGDRVLAVTSAHFTEFQGAEVERLAYKRGVTVETIGYDPADKGEKAKRPDELAQEFHSLVNSVIKTGEFMGVLPRPEI